MSTSETSPLSDATIPPHYVDGIHDTQCIERLITKYKNARYSFYWRSNSTEKIEHFHWHIPIADGGKRNTEDMFGDLITEELRDERMVAETARSEIMEWAVRTHGVRLQAVPLVRIYVNGYTHGTDALAHRDSIRDNEITAVTYLNAKWDRNWGGETIVYKGDHDIVVSALPKAGRTVFFPAHFQHGARAISKSCPDLRIVLVMKFRLDLTPPVITDNPRYSNAIANLLEWKTDTIVHSGTTLFKHLVGTYDELVAAGADEDICYAGLFHSVYGTTFFDPKLNLSRKQVIDVIGTRAEYLAHLFCQIKRPDCFKVATDPASQIISVPTNDGSYVMILLEDFEALKQIHVANGREITKRRKGGNA